MTADKLYELLGDIDQTLINECDARPRPKAKPDPARQKWYAAVACLCIAVCIALPLMLHKPDSPHSSDQSDVQGDTGNNTQPPHISLGGVAYYSSSHIPTSRELPEGYELTEDASFIGYSQSSPCYVNPDRPEWIYVYSEMRNAYVCYVDQRLRGSDIICYNGEYYISMRNAHYSSSAPAVTKEYYVKMDNKYGRYIDGYLPDGFELAGEAVFTGKDTVPTGALASNDRSGEVYYSTNDPDVLLMEDEKMLNPRYYVYIRYDCPFAP
ncbi:MAG: hypothetical protein IJE90_06075 [Clostridia bacterium]|nr:hypothetical protein [Clostridia bacterium]